MIGVGDCFNLTPCRFEQWVRFDLWELRQAAFILSGFEPPEMVDLCPTPDDPYGLTPPILLNWADFLAGSLDRKIEPSFRIAGQWSSLESVRTLIRALEAAIKSGALLAEQPFAEGWYETYVKPDVAVRWAKAKDYRIPPELEPIASSVAPISADSTDSPAETIPPRTKGTLYELLAALFLVNYDKIPPLDVLQGELTAIGREFDPDFLKDTLKKVAEKVNKIK